MTGLIRPAAAAASAAAARRRKTAGTYAPIPFTVTPRRRTPAGVQAGEPAVGPAVPGEPAATGDDPERGSSQLSSRPVEYHVGAVARGELEYLTAASLRGKSGTVRLSLLFNPCFLVVPSC